MFDISIDYADIKVFQLWSNLEVNLVLFNFVFYNNCNVIF